VEVLIDVKNPPGFIKTWVFWEIDYIFYDAANVGFMALGVLLWVPFKYSTSNPSNALHAYFFLII